MLQAHQLLLWSACPSAATSSAACAACVFAVRRRLGAGFGRLRTSLAPCSST